LLATADLSATLRQGILLTFGQPVQTSKAFLSELKVIFSEKNYKEIDTLVHNMVYAEKGEQHKLYLAPIEEAAKISTLEESYMGRVIERVPIIGQIVRASERAYNTFLNVQRAEVWSYWCRKWENTGKTWKDYDDLASFINHATGRGDLGALENAGAWLNAAFFAPRYLASRIQAPLDLITSTPAVRKVVARNLIAFVATGMSALALASLAGAETEDDPRSADFGKIKIGNTRIEFWGGYLPYVRFLTQVITEQRKVTKTGAMVDVDWTDVVSMFVRSKLAPIPGLVWDLKEGQTFIGEELTPENAPQILYEKLTPMFAQDLADALNDANTSTAEATAYGLMAAFGIGVQTYEDNWGSAEDNLGLPVREEGLPYTIKNPIYDTGDYYSDVGEYIGTATYDMLKDKQGIS